LPRSRNQSAGEPSQRQLRVGELVRHALADVLARGEVIDPDLDGVIVTIAEVRVSADLRHATALVAPLSHKDPAQVATALNRNARFLRGRIAPALRQMRNIPDLKFQLDTRFDDDSRIDALLRSPDVVRDLPVVSDGESDGGSDADGH
jgi:ribosome-binding factor A